MYDLESDPQALTAQAQVQILQSTQFLISQGQHYLVDFGYANALEKAEDLGWTGGGARSR